MLLVAVPAFAEEVDQGQELQRVVDAQQRQLEAQQREIETLMQMLKQLQSEVELLVTSADKEPATPGEGGAPTQPPSASDEDSNLASTSAIESDEPRAPTKIGVSQVDRFDPETPAGVDVTYLSPTAVIHIPGTETSVGVHGMLQFQIAHDTSGPASNQFNTASIPVDGAPPETKFNVNPSRFVISSVTRVSDSGQLNTLISTDFNGHEEVPEPRLRLAWVEYVNEDLGIGVIGGQAFPTMVDLRAVPEMLDFAIPAGAWAQRQGLLRLTKSLSEDSLVEVSIETPQNVRYINGEKRTRLPDAALAGTWILNGGHFKLGALARDLRAEDVNGATDSALGWAVSASGSLDLPFLGKRTDLRLTVHHGDGYGTQIKGGPEEAVFDTAASELDLIGLSGVFGGLQHFWSDKFRSNLTFGYLSADNPASAASNALASTTYASANFIWVPYKQLTLGVEYLYGERKDFDGASGTSNRLLLSSRLDF